MAERTYIMQEFFGEGRQALVEYIPHAVELGMVVESAGPGQVVMKIPMRDDLVGDPTRGVVFGGVITTLLDQVGGAATMCAMPELVAIATIGLRIDYMKPATPGRDLRGFAECYRLTRNVAFVRGEAYHTDRDDAFAHFVSTYMLGSTPMLPGVLDHMERKDDG